jgi:hypothetical protein
VPTAPTIPASTALSPEVIEMARRAVQDFRECFWFRHPDADIVDHEDLDLVIQRLRQYGGHRAWQRASELLLCR